MLKIKYPKYAFAIRFSREKSTVQHALLFNFLEEITEVYPSFKVEGINTKKRNSKKETKNPILEVREDDSYVEIGNYATKLRDVIGVGISSKYAVSFESLEELAYNSCFRLYSVPILTLDAHYALIIKKLTAFVKAHFVKAPVSIKITVRNHSNFARVSTSSPCILNSRLNYSNYHELDNYVSKETPYSLKSMSII